MNRGLRIALVIGGILVAAILTAILWPVEKEPQYQGKKLSEWLGAAALGDVKKEQAKEAVRHIGTNAIPWLLRWVADPHASDTPKSHLLLMKCISKLPKGLRARLQSRLGRVDPAWLGKGSADKGFMYLGEQAHSGVSALAEIALHTNQQAISALEIMGPAGIPGLIKVVEHPGLPWRGYCLDLLVRPGLRTNTSVILPVVLGRLGDPQRDIVESAVRTLRTEKIAPESVIPALATAANHPDPCIRYLFADALGNYAEASATAAKLALDPYLQDSDAEVRRRAISDLSMCETYERRNQIFERARVQGPPPQPSRPYPKYPAHPGP